MSLDFAAFVAADKAWSEMEKRLKRLLGCVPAISDHYGMMSMHNVKISLKNSDEELVKIHSDFLSWKNEIVKMFAEKGITLDEGLWRKLSEIDRMFGAVYFLNVPIDIYSGVDKYRAVLEKLLDYSAEINGIEMRLREALKWALA